VSFAESVTNAETTGWRNVPHSAQPHSIMTAVAETDNLCRNTGHYSSQGGSMGK